MTDIEVYEEPMQAVVPHRQQHGLADLAMLADRIARTGMVPSAFRNKPDEVLAVFLYGQECGLPVMQSLQLIDMIQGRPTLNAQGQRALILGAGHYIKTLSDESTPTVAKVKCRRSNWPEGEFDIVSFTIDEARSQGWLSKEAWKKGPADMLVARATTRAARRHFSDVCLGLAYDADEITGPDYSAPVVEGADGQRELAAPEPLTPDRIQKFLAYAEEHGVSPGEAILRACGEDASVGTLTAADVPKLTKAIKEIAADAAQTSAPAEETEVPAPEAGSSVGGEDAAGETTHPPAASDSGSARRRFFALCTEKWGPGADKERREWMQANFGVGSSRDLDLKAAADLLAEQLSQGQLISLDDLIAEGEIVEEGA